MMRAFQVGDKVEVLDEAIKGTVTAITEGIITIADEDGFPLGFEPRQLVLIEDGIHVSIFEIAQIKSQKETKKKRNTAPRKPKERNAPKMEVDLHIHQLANSTRGNDKF